MTESKKLLKNTFIYAIGNLGSKIILFALLPILSFYLSKDDLGEYDIILTTISLFVPLASFQTSDAIYRWLLTFDENNGEKKRIITNGTLLVLILLIIFSLGYFIVSHFYDVKYRYYFWGMLIASVLLPYAQQTVRGLKHNKIYTLAGIINASLILLLNLLFLLQFKWGLKSLFVALIVSSLFTSLFLFLAGGIFKYIQINLFSFNLMKKLLKYSIPLIPNNINWWLINAADKFIILYFLGVGANGIYAISIRFPAIITILNTIFILAWQDHSILNEGSKIDGKMFDRLFTFQLTLSLILITLSRFVAQHLVSPEFYESYKYMVIIYVGVAYSCFAGYFGAYYLRLKRTGRIFMSSIGAGLINIILAFSLIKYIGLYASALGTFVGFLFMFVYRVYDLRKEIDFSINAKKLIFLTILCFIASGVVLFGTLLCNYCVIVVAIAIFLYYNKEVLVKFKYLIKNRIAKQ